MLYRVHLPGTGFELTTIVAIDIDCTGSCKSNYQTITTTMAHFILANDTSAKWKVKQFGCIKIYILINLIKIRLYINRFLSDSFFSRARVAQWARLLDYLATHRSLSPIRRGFASRFVNYKKGWTRLAAASDKVYQLFVHSRWFSPRIPASSTTKTGRHDIAEMLLNMALNTINQISQEEFEDTKGAIRIRISKKNRQYNGQNKKYKRTNNFSVISDLIVNGHPFLYIKWNLGSTRVYG